MTMMTLYDGVYRPNIDTEQGVEDDEGAARHEVDEDDPEAVVGDVVEHDVVGDERSLDVDAALEQRLVVGQRRH